VLAKGNGMSESVKRLIESYAKDIKEKINKPGTVSLLFGEPIDMDDPDAVLVAAVCMTQQEERNKQKKEREFLFEIPAR
jgi:hypothetical protein